jgi:hypothetical protein
VIRSERQFCLPLSQRFVLCVCLVLCGPLGCEMWLAVDVPQCKTNKDCVGLLGRGYTCASDGVCMPPEAAPSSAKPDAGESAPRLPARWACAADSKADFVSDPDKKITLRMDAVDLNTLRVPSGLVATACNATDFGCNTPVVTDATPGDDGFLEFEVPYGWEGYLMFNAPNIVPAISLTNKPYLASQTTSGPALLTFKSKQDLSEHSGMRLEPGKGVVIFEMRDCNDMAGDGIIFDPAGDQLPFYFDGALPANTVKATMVSNLLAAGRESRAVAGFANLPPSYMSFQARLASSGAEIVNVTVPIRADEITYVRVYAGK